jgi:acyl-CoA reductase-like NAD-dependent aldehyde dehydrogenase
MCKHLKISNNCFLVDIKETDALMADELFGPILPIITTNSKEDALKFIKSRHVYIYIFIDCLIYILSKNFVILCRPKPLALYVFSRSKPTLEYFIENSSSGAICCNDVVIHFTRALLFTVNWKRVFSKRLCKTVGMDFHLGA